MDGLFRGESVEWAEFRPFSGDGPKNNATNWVRKNAKYYSGITKNGTICV